MTSRTYTIVSCGFCSKEWLASTLNKQQKYDHLMSHFDDIFNRESTTFPDGWTRDDVISVLDKGNVKS